MTGSSSSEINQEVDDSALILSPLLPFFELFPCMFSVPLKVSGTMVDS